MDAALQQTSSKIHPLKFALWIGCASILMMFAAFTSAYIVRHAAGNWLEFRLPNIFYVSTVAILLSSIALQASFVAFKKKKESQYRLLLVLALAFGLAFIVLQYQGWMAMQAIGVFLDGNPSGSFVYLITGVHAAHVLGGLAVLTMAAMHAFLLKFEVTAGRKLRFELTLTYWHFVGFLWLYLIFFLLNF
jgi:cytochrome c oxidase subunit 3